jgi:hypothetical protein
MNEAHNPAECFDVIVTPNPEILRTNAAFGKDRCCFRQHEPGAANSAAAQMDKVPIGRKAIHARVLAHRRDEHPIGKFYFSNREQIKQASHGQLSVISS